MIAALRPAPETALVLVVALPPPLEALRTRSIEDAPGGVPAHITLLYPFAEETQLDSLCVNTIRTTACWRLSAGSRHATRFSG